jgi:hypothetical protein
MMNSVQARRHDQKAQDSLKSPGQFHVRVMKQDRGEQKRLPD